MCVSSMDTDRSPSSVLSARPGSLRPCGTGDYCGSVGRSEMSKENTENTVQDSSTRHVVRQIQKHMQDINKLLDLLGRCSASGPFKRNGLSREQSIGAVRSYKKGRTV